MRVFQNVEDLGNLKLALEEAAAIKKDRFQFQHLGRHKTALLIFFNNSLLPGQNIYYYGSRNK